MNKFNYGGWSNEPTMFAWGAVNPWGNLISKEKPELTYSDREKDKEEIRKFLEARFNKEYAAQVDIDELIEHLYK